MCWKHCFSDWPTSLLSLLRVLYGQSSWGTTSEWCVSKLFSFILGDEIAIRSTQVVHVRVLCQHRRNARKSRKQGSPSHYVMYVYCAVLVSITHISNSSRSSCHFSWNLWTAHWKHWRLVTKRSGHPIQKFLLVAALVTCQHSFQEQRGYTVYHFCVCDRGKSRCPPSTGGSHLCESWKLLGVC